MPTAANLFSALALGLLAAVVSEMIKPLMPEGMDFGYFTYVNFAFGAVIGWKLLGKNAGRGIMPSVNAGITAMLAMVLILLFAHACWQMMGNSLNLRYDRTAEAIQSIFKMMGENGLLLLHPPILVTLFVGAVLAGLLAEAISRRWR
ncbi:TrgA family protein [Cognatishimia sp. SS12]|uniref:TrgA family protein n=1 Tax=Cognatishimia sp. SS12 TaxID=2979465 RepID=UPI00232BEC67|nr:TrgA family protein [Cognatishimia sp. SS12]MDC0737226.1 TrgA family protein [Cognatishimia sp. SS12]